MLLIKGQKASALKKGIGNGIVVVENTKSNGNNHSIRDRKSSLEWFLFLVVRTKTHFSHLLKSLHSNFSVTNPPFFHWLLLKIQIQLSYNSVQFSLRFSSFLVRQDTNIFLIYLKVCSNFSVTNLITFFHWLVHLRMKTGT